MKVLFRPCRLLLLLVTLSWVIQDVHASGSIRHGRSETNENKETATVTQGDEASIVNRIHDDGDGDPERRDQVTIEVVAPYPISVATPEFDLGERFSKVVFQNPSIDTSRLPLTYVDYPINDQTADWLRESQCPSIMTPGNCDECEGVNFTELVQEIGGPPSHPDFSPEGDYWDELLEVVRVQDHRRNQALTGVPTNSVLPIPRIWEGFSLEDVADAVHDEFPGIHHTDLIGSYLADGLRVDETVVPQMCKVEFLRGPVMLSHLNTWAIAQVGPTNFAVKYWVGRSRPEEMAFKISQRDERIAPRAKVELLQRIDENSLQSAEAFTAYPEGSPMHPSWPAMHSAASVGSLWLPTVLNLTEEQMCQAQLLDYAIAYGRTVAGVHYASDNIAGLKLGQKIVAERMPAYLESMYGADPNLVRQKIDRVMFDWDTFLDSDCYRNNMTPLPL